MRATYILHVAAVASRGERQRRATILHGVLVGHIPLWLSTRPDAPPEAAGNVDDDDNDDLIDDCFENCLC
jgi:hypothetical protein